MPTLTDAATLPELTTDEMSRYSRHIILPEVGMEGQRRLKAAKVLCVGTGGLGSPAALYLAAAGVGTLGLADDDAVSLSNLQRQILFRTADIGRAKVEAGAEALKALNPGVQVQTHKLRLTAANAMEIITAMTLSPTARTISPRAISSRTPATSRGNRW